MAVLKVMCATLLLMTLLVAVGQLAIGQGDRDRRPARSSAALMLQKPVAGVYRFGAT